LLQLSLVDLAGSERAGKTDASAEQLKVSKTFSPSNASIIQLKLPM
jgi:hypothetical protein